MLLLISRLSSTGSLSGSFTAYCNFSFKATQLLAHWVQHRGKLLLLALPFWKALLLYRVSYLSAAKPVLLQRSLVDPAFQHEAREARTSLHCFLLCL